MNVRSCASMAVLLAAASLAAAACGDDDGGGSALTTVASTAAATTAPPATTAVAATAVAATTATGGEYVDVCALATEMAGQDSFPTHAQLTKYQEIAPAEIAATVGVAASALLAVPDADVLNFFKAAAKDDVEAAIHELNAWETANCGIEHEDEIIPPGSTRDVEAGAARVDVRAEDFKLPLPSTVAPGRTSFVLTNHGAEVHHIVVFQLAEGVTFEQAMSAEDDDGMITGSWSSGLAFPDGEDEEAITLDLIPGNYGIACFIAGADGTPHAFGHGMMAEFAVA